MSFIFHEGLSKMQGELGTSAWGWIGPDDFQVQAGFAINFPPTWASTGVPPPEVPAPVAAGTIDNPLNDDFPYPPNSVYVAHLTPVTGRTVVGGKCYSDPITWPGLPDTYGFDHWKGPGAGSPALWPEYWPLIRVYGIVITLVGGNVPLIFRDDLGVTSVDLAGDPLAGANYQNVTFNTAGLPWLQFAR
jgi:hypothetical protein